MTTTKLLLSALGILTATAAFAQAGEPMYNITYYSDASYTTVVGGSRPSCTNRGVTYRPFGQQTAFRQEELAAYCENGRAEPA